MIKICNIFPFYALYLYSTYVIWSCMPAKRIDYTWRHHLRRCRHHNRVIAEANAL